MGYFGVNKAIRWGEFTGICPELDPTELPTTLASDAQNIDFDGKSATVRKGSAYYNSGGGPTGGSVWGAGVFYPPNGSPRSVIMAGAGKVFADNDQDGEFSDSDQTILSGLTDGIPVDIFQWKSRLFAGTSANGLFAGNEFSLTPALPPSAPTEAPRVTVLQTMLEDFESGTWTGTDAALTASVQVVSSTDPPPFTGVKSLRMTATAATAEGKFVYHRFVNGSGTPVTMDLTGYAYVEVLVWCNVPKPTFRIGFYPTVPATGDPVVAWEDFPAFTVTSEDTKQWFKVKVPLGTLSATSLAAIPGMAIQFLGAGGRGYNKPLRIWFDAARFGSYLDPGNYQYYWTYENNEEEGESLPSPAGTLKLEEEQLCSAIRIWLSGTMGVKVRFYRYQDNGNFQLPRRILEEATAGLVPPYMHDDRMSNGALAIAAAQGDAPELDLKRTNPPPAVTYAAVNNRVLAGGVTVSPDFFPQRVWVSYFGNPYGWSASENPDDPLSAGWFDLPEKDPIVRIIDYHGVALIFTTRSVWTLTGSGFADFNLVKRGSFGLLAREAVVEAGGVVYFQTVDGVRVLMPHTAVADEYECFLISEPIASRIASSASAGFSVSRAMGQDERGRIHVSAGTSAFIFDPRMPGALDPGTRLDRPGWSYHTQIGCVCYTQLRRGGFGTGWTDAGQLIGGRGFTAPGALRLLMLFRSIDNSEIYTNPGLQGTWFWTSPALLAEAGFRVVAQWVTGMFLAAAGQSITAEILDESDSTKGSATLALGSGTAGFVEPAPVRYGPGARGKAVRLKLSGSHAVPMSIRQAILGVFQR